MFQTVAAEKKVSFPGDRLRQFSISSKLECPRHVEYLNNLPLVLSETSHLSTKTDREDSTVIFLKLYMGFLSISWYN